MQTAKIDLARAYAPDVSDHAATNRLRQWMTLDPVLMQRLDELHYRPRARYFTPQQLEVIYERLGRP